MSNQWLRLWHDMPNDPKWRTIARVSGQRIGDVMAVYVHMLVSASMNTERGVTQCDAEDVASALDMETEQVKSIFEAMQGRVAEGNYLSGWEIRQPKREDNSKERMRALRVKKKSDAPVTQCDAPEEDKDTDKDISSEPKGSSLTARTIKPPKIGLADLTVDHIAAWLAEKRLEGKYVHHDPHFVLEYFRNYCQSKGRKYADYIAAYRNAFEWEPCKPRLSGKNAGGVAESAWTAAAHQIIAEDRATGRWEGRK